MDAVTTILIATTNRGKLREVREILSDTSARLAILEEFPDLPPAVEDADTFEGNADLKALHYARLTGMWVLADDSGLMVDALEGAPGVHSARYAGPAADPASNNAKLVSALAGVPSDRRTARFCCAVSLADGSGVLVRSFATWEGMVVDKPRGSGGFGYDPHFYVPGEGRTAAELTPERKNQLSHRGKAFHAIRGQIKQLLRSGQGCGAEPERDACGGTTD